MASTARRRVAFFTPSGRTVTGVAPRTVLRVLAIVPAHDEARSLPGVIADLRAECPWLPVLVVDDGSSDGTARVGRAHGADTVSLGERLGVGSAVRTGLRFALRHGYDAVVRLDGDGQHAARDAASVLAPILNGTADVVLGSRYAAGQRPDGGVGRRLVQRTLARLVSWLTGDRATDPTCGFCAFGPSALRLLAEHHPSGYPEPELRLLLCRSGLDVVEVAVEARPRTAGHSTLTTARLWFAAARVLLAMIVVPLRDQPTGGADD